MKPKPTKASPSDNGKQPRPVKPYRPSPSNSVETSYFNELRKDRKVQYFTIGKLSNAKHFYKYMDLDATLLSLENENLQFVEPSRWDDQYEKRFYLANYDLQTNNQEEDCPLLFATCMTTNRFNEPSWILYTHGKTGNGATCVEIQINKHKFRQQLVKACSKHDKVYEGNVEYLSTYVVDNIHRKCLKDQNDKDNPFYHKYAEKKNGMNYITNYMNLMLIKRDAFKHENETRFFIVKDDMRKQQKAQKTIEAGKECEGQRIFLKIDWVEVIEKIYINAKEGSKEYNLLSDALKKLLERKFKNDNVTADGMVNEKDENKGDGNNGKENKTNEAEKETTKSTEKERIWNERLKPEPYFIYGEKLDKPLVIGEQD